MLDAKSVLAAVTEENIISMMADLGSPVMGRGVSGNGTRFLQFRTICHGGDSSKLYFYVDSKTFYCYTCCGSMSLFDFIIKVKSLDQKQFYEAVKYVADFIDYKETFTPQTGFYSSKTQIFSRENLSENFRESFLKCKNEPLTHIRPYIIEPEKETEMKWELYKMDHNFFSSDWIDEGISIDTMRKFEICFEWTHCYIILPHRDVYGNLVGIRRRSLHPDDMIMKRKYTPYTTNGGISFNHELGQNWYGLSQLSGYSREEIDKCRDLYIFEGEKSVMKMDTVYSSANSPGKISLGACGFNVSTPQIEFFTKYNIEENPLFGSNLSRRIYICFDKDFSITDVESYKRDQVLKENYNHYIKKLSNICKKLIACGFDESNVFVVLDRKELLEENDSPIDKGKQVFEALIDDALTPEQLDSLFIN